MLCQAVPGPEGFLLAPEPATHLAPYPSQIRFGLHSEPVDQNELSIIPDFWRTSTEFQTDEGWSNQEYLFIIGQYFRIFLFYERADVSNFSVSLSKSLPHVSPGSDEPRSHLL
jgi:hypothetical protein